MAVCKSVEAIGNNKTADQIIQRPAGARRAHRRLGSGPFTSEAAFCHKKSHTGGVDRQAMMSMKDFKGPARRRAQELDQQAIA